MTEPEDEFESFCTESAAIVATWTDEEIQQTEAYFANGHRKDPNHA